MPKTATLRKATLKKATASTSKKATKSNSNTKKTALKIVKSDTKKAKTAKKTVKKAVTKTAAKKAPTKKQTARPITKKTATKPAAVKKTSATKATKKTIAKKVETKATTKTTATAKKTAKSKKATARPITVSSGFNRAARINSIVQKRAKANSIKKQEAEFKVGCHVVYPTHGVGKIVDEETQEIGGTTLKMFVIEFVKDKMTLRVPVHRAKASGLRHVSSTPDIKKMYDTLKSKAKTSRGMWSRRAQEYEAKINSGDVIMIAEVVRDLHQNVDQAERSYSERMIYESAFNRLAGELSASESTAYESAGDKLLKLLRAKKAA